MSDIHGPDDLAGSRELVDESPPADIPPDRTRRRGRRARRVVLICAVSVVIVIGAVALGGYATVNHLAGNVKRIPNVFAGLDAAHRPVMPAATQKSITILLTGSNVVPATRSGNGANHASTASESVSGLIALLGG